MRVPARRVVSLEASQPVSATALGRPHCGGIVAETVSGLTTRRAGHATRSLDATLFQPPSHAIATSVPQDGCESTSMTGPGSGRARRRTLPECVRRMPGGAPPRPATVETQTWTTPGHGARTRQRSRRAASGQPCGIAWPGVLGDVRLVSNEIELAISAGPGTHGVGAVSALGVGARYQSRHATWRFHRTGRCCARTPAARPETSSAPTAPLGIRSRTSSPPGRPRTRAAPPRRPPGWSRPARGWCGSGG